MAKFRPGRRLYVNAARTKLVDGGGPEPAVLLCSAHGEIDERLARRLGLLDPPPATVVVMAPAAHAPEPLPEIEAAAVPEPAEDKMIEPAEDKAAPAPAHSRSRKE